MPPETSRPGSVLLVADPFLPVPPLTYGGIERIVAFLAEELAARGWDVTLACHPDSRCPIGKIVFPVTTTSRTGRVRNAATIVREVVGGCYDIIHSFGHSDLTAAFWPAKRPKIQSFQALPHEESFARRMRVLPRRNLHFTVCGRHMMEKLEQFAPTVAIHNGVALAPYAFQEKVADDAPLVFLGRIEPIKGTHHAIQIAKRTGRRLMIAGNISDNQVSRDYFAREVKPHLSGPIEYIGEVDDAGKNSLLGGAAAFLMPIEWDEPFGIVMAEALACGTPVIGLSRGAVPEIVREGVTGACCSSIDEMVDAVGRLGTFSRAACRHDAETRFSAPMIVDQYIDFYYSVLGRP